ncbi:fibronectin type III domain-containing protein [Streptomyces sp. NEAU-H22]|uniref:fibronectin type III domain-containing protein n=1 Tax=unclassified Streptomyces TaxID=2593676 RepID=UPI002258DB94|nr:MULTISPECIES: fibronectin type III domain-containing protein [unclassified Streptomyces]MCX3292302.1 fibronectin type III domain-containing protein [Streptomyces sp. NEAU-H22]WMD06815.1 fibronectin type III domain-containing protein [Streptomyces sp. FXY-T5]
MRGRSAPRSLPRRLALCGALLLLASCGWVGAEERDGVGVPGAPTGVTAAAGSATSVHVMWNATDRADRYEVYRGTTKVREVPGSQHMVDVTRLRPSTRYLFTVRARGVDGRLGPPSRRVPARTPASAADDRSAPTRPSAPRGRAAGSRAVQLSWSASTDNRGVVSYDIHQGGTKIHSVGGAQTATVLTGLRPGTAYAFTVRARDAAGNVSPAGPAVRLTTPGRDDGRATAPTGFRATSHREDGAYQLDLSWVPPRVDGEVTEYQIHLDGRPATSLVYGGAAPRERATYSFYAGRRPGVTHRVRVRAMLPDGTWGGFSAERAVTTGSGR